MPNLFHTTELDENVRQNMIEVLLAPTEFVMGSPPDEPGRFSDETQHKVLLTKPFAIGRYPVTHIEWIQLTERDSAKRILLTGPVTDVTWREATIFCEQLTIRHQNLSLITSAQQYRLPTEAEWEYACRAGTTTAYNCGHELTTEVANFSVNTGITPVGKYPPNAWGLHDMHGNVWEWCQNWYAEYPDCNSARYERVDVSITGHRVARGGSWGDLARFCRSACRNIEEPGGRWDGLGFRLALSLLTTQ